jgi:hypothetical protein
MSQFQQTATVTPEGCTRGNLGQATANRFFRIGNATGHDDGVGLWWNEGDESVKVISGGGSRFRGGLFVISIELRRDRIVFSIFLSRPTPFIELQERLTLSESTRTEYVMQPSATEIVDGKGVIEFTPGLPTEATWLALGEPGRWLTLYA